MVRKIPRCPRSGKGGFFNAAGLNVEYYNKTMAIMTCKGEVSNEKNICNNVLIAGSPVSLCR